MAPVDPVVTRKKGDSMLVQVSRVLSILAMLSACASTDKTEAVQAESIDGRETAASEQPVPAYRFHPGDELSISAVRRPELTLTARVDPFGFISYPYLGQVKVRGLTPTQLAEQLKRGLEEGEYYTNPVITVSLVSSRDQFVYVLGEVKRPGPVSVTGGTTLLAAISSAGGQTYDAKMASVLWIRGSQVPPGVVKLDLDAFGDPRKVDANIPNVIMLPGDVLFVPDTVIASVERFMTRMLNIIRPVVELERGIVLYPDVQAALKGESEGGRTITIISP